MEKRDEEFQSFLLLKVFNKYFIMCVHIICSNSQGAKLKKVCYYVR